MISKQRIVVTGASGRSGSRVAERLSDRGAEVYGLCHSLPPGNHSEINFRSVELTDLGETQDVILNVDPDAVVHFGAIPDPKNDPGSRVFDNNVSSTYNVLMAAGRTDARVVWASSEATYGYSFSRDLQLPSSLPIDETHPTEPEDPYGTSKIVGEELAQMVTRRFKIPTVSLRISWIQYPGEYRALERQENFDPTDLTKSNFWSYVDIRDVVSAVEAALEAPVTGHEAFNVHAADNSMAVDTTTLFEQLFGTIPETCTLSGEESAFTTEKASRLLDWEPTHSWREANEEHRRTPSFLTA
jgi:nucleoside-diphosphate-sugar epimerase